MRRLKKAIVSLSLLSPIIATVSCGGTENKGPSKTELENIRQIKEINENANITTTSDFLEEEINKKTEEDWMFTQEVDQVSGRIYDWDSAKKNYGTDNECDIVIPNFPNHLWGDISETTLEPALHKQVSFMKKDLSKEISTFVLNYMSLNDWTRDTLTNSGKTTVRGDTVFEYKIDRQAYRGDDKEVIPIFSWGGPLLSMNKNLHSFEVLRIWRMLTQPEDIYSEVKSLYDKKINHIPRVFEQPQYNFYPKLTFLKKFGWNPFRHRDDVEGYTVDHDLMDKLRAHLDTLKGFKNYSLYERAVMSGDISGYTALKLLTENIDLKPSELFEVISAGLAKISAQKKEILSEIYQNQDIVWVGGSYGNDDVLQSILLDNDILYKSKAVILWGNFLRNAIRGSNSTSGGIVTDIDFKTQKKDASAGWVEESIFHSVNILKSKYGFINRLKAKFESDSKFKEEFIKKVHIYIGNNDKIVGRISDYEKNFYDQYHIDYHFKDGGHDFDIIDKGNDFWKNIMHMERPNYTLPNYTGDYRYTVKKGRLIDPRPHFDWTGVTITHGN